MVVGLFILLRDDLGPIKSIIIGFLSGMGFWLISINFSTNIIKAAETVKIIFKRKKDR